MVNQIKEEARKLGLTLHRDCQGPVDHGRIVFTIRRHRMLDYLKEKGHKNFAFYADHGWCVRFASW